MKPWLGGPALRIDIQLDEAERHYARAIENSAQPRGQVMGSPRRHQARPPAARTATRHQTPRDRFRLTFAGEEWSGYVSPFHVVTADNIEFDGGPGNVFDPDNGYRDEYRKI